MNKTNLLLASVLTLAVANHVSAETSNVFCGKLDGSDWYWLTDSTNTQIIVSGERDVYFKNNLYYRYFSISEADYLPINAQCRLGYVAQPAMNLFDGWYIFKLQKSNDTFYFAPGHNTGLRDLEGSWSDLRGTWSDINLKQGIQPLQGSLDKISRVGGYSYSWRPDSIQDHKAGETEYGVIAQQIQAEFPGLVKQDDQGYLRVDYRGLIPVLLESIKELNARVEALEAQS